MKRCHPGLARVLASQAGPPANLAKGWKANLARDRLELADAGERGLARASYGLAGSG